MVTTPLAVPLSGVPKLLTESPVRLKLPTETKVSAAGSYLTVYCMPMTSVKPLTLTPTQTCCPWATVSSDKENMRSPPPPLPPVPIVTVALFVDAASSLSLESIISIATGVPEKLTAAIALSAVTLRHNSKMGSPSGTVTPAKVLSSQDMVIVPGV